MTRVLAALLLAPGPARSQAPRAVWLWERDTFRLLDDPAARADAIDFFAEHGISIVYAYADAFRSRTPIADQPELYRALVRSFADRGIRTYALLGSAPLNTPAYVLPERRPAAEAMFQRVLDYNAASAPSERFSGVNLDIEPYLLPDWETNRLERAVQYLDLSRRFAEMRDASGQDLPIGPATPFWFDTVLGVDFAGAVKPLHEHVLDVHDYAALMDYRDTVDGPDGMLAHASNEIEYAARVGKSVVIGVETLRMSPELEKLSFHDEGAEALEAALAAVEAAWGARPAFGGFAIHHYAPYRRLVEGGRAGGDLGAEGGRVTGGVVVVADGEGGAGGELRMEGGPN